MLLFQLLNTIDSKLTPGKTKVHLACFNGTEQPLDVYRRGVEDWEEWQRWQNRKNFEREFVVSLIDIPLQPGLWMFAGAYQKIGREVRPDSPDRWYYALPRLTEFDDIAARVVIRYQRRDRASYRDAETVEHQLVVQELRPRPLTLPSFPGYKQVHVSFSQLGALVRASELSWRTALSAVSGVYLLVDSADGKLYVGSAYGEGGIWSRWSDYLNGHGGNKELKELVGAEKAQRAETFSFAILETADTSAGREDIVAREAHWKRVLLSRQFGHNAN